MRVDVNICLSLASVVNDPSSNQYHSAGEERGGSVQTVQQKAPKSDVAILSWIIL